jgi:hypothetical protein
MKSCLPLVPYLFKVVPYWSVIMVLSTFLQLSYVKPTQVCSAPAGRQVISTTLAAPQKDLDLNSAFENADRLLDQKKRTGGQFHYMILQH